MYCSGSINVLETWSVCFFGHGSIVHTAEATGNSTNVFHLPSKSDFLSVFQFIRVLNVFKVA